MNIHNCLQELKRESDWLSGMIPLKVRIPNGDWTPYLPDFDSQKIGFETEACVPFAATEAIETQINYFIKTNQLPDYHLNKLKELGFITSENTFEASERFMAKVDGTTPQNGTPLQNPWDAIRKYGMLPWTDWPYDTTIKTIEQFYCSVPQNLIDKAKEFNKLFTVKYEWIVNNYTGTNVAAMKNHLQHAPLMIGTPVCQNWNQIEVPTCSGQQAAHATMVYNIDDHTYILDHYAPFLKKFNLDYPIPYVIKGVIEILPIQPTIDPISNNATPEQTQKFYLQVQNWLNWLLSFIKQTYGKIRGIKN